jgi:hypothetical protein
MRGASRRTDCAEGWKGRAGFVSRGMDDGKREPLPPRTQAVPLPSFPYLEAAPEAGAAGRVLHALEHVPDAAADGAHAWRMERGREGEEGRLSV